MAPQPLNRVLRNGDIHITPTALDQRPHLAPLIAKAVAIWSEMEHVVSSILALILHANAAPAIAMYYSLNSTSACTIFNRRSSWKIWAARP